MIDSAVDVITNVVANTWSTFLQSWPFLLLSVLLASAITVYIGADRLSGWLKKKIWLAIVGSVVLATVTPFCSCGTMAIVIGALATRVPWAPVVAFIVASPLTSPHEYVYSIGLFGMGFATTFFVAAVVLGLVAGALTHVIELTGWLEGQARAAESSTDASSCGDGGAADDCCEPAPSGGILIKDTDTDTKTEAQAAVSLVSKYKLDELRASLWQNTRHLSILFFSFAALGYLVLEFIPTNVLTDYLGDNSPFAVPLAALLGIPFYFDSDGSLPLISTLMQGGMGPGAALAFLITGAGTSVAAISGMFIIARKKIIVLVVGILTGGAILLGWAAPLWL